MRIDTTGIHAKHRTVQTPTSRPTTPGTRSGREGGDSVEMSSGARMMSIAREALSDVPDVRQSIVEGVRERLSSGAVSHDGSSIARAMIDTICAEAANAPEARQHQAPESEIT